MSRSQRHKTIFENYPSDCKIGAEGAVSPGYMRQLPGPFVVPMGPSGGPLQGSSLAGPAPAGALPTGDLLKLLALGALVSGGGPFVPPDESGEVPPTEKPPEVPPLGGSTAVRTFPIGPITISTIIFDTNDNDLAFTMADDPNVASIQVGDTVRVEATGNASVNGDKVVTAVSTEPVGTFWVDGEDPGNGGISGKGRVTIISGA